MTQPSLQSAHRMDIRLLLVGMLPLTCLGLVAAGTVAAGEPKLAIAAGLAVPAIGGLLLRPEAGIPLAMFLLYSNALVVAVRFHGVPAAAAMLAPMPLLLPLFRNLLQLRTLVTTPALPWILGWVSWQLVCAMLSVNPVKSVNGVLGTVLEGLALYILIINVVRSPSLLRMAIWSLIAAGAFMGSVSVYQQATRSFHTNLGGFGQVSEGEGFEVSEGAGTTRQRRLCGPIGEQNRYAQVMLMLLPLAASSVLAEADTRLKLTALAASGLIAAGFGLTFSRSGAISFVLMLLISMSLGLISRRLVMSILFGGFVLLLLIPQYRTRLATVPTALGLFDTAPGSAEPDGAIRGRATEMLATARMALDHPLFGVGPELSGDFTREYGQLGGLKALEGPRESHCLYLEVAGETGIPGLLLFTGMLMASVRSLLIARSVSRLHHRHLHHLAAAFLLALTAYLSMGIFLHMSYVRYFWLMLGLADAAALVCLTQSGTGFRSVPQGGLS